MVDVEKVLLSASAPWKSAQAGHGSCAATSCRLGHTLMSLRLELFSSAFDLPHLLSIFCAEYGEC